MPCWDGGWAQQSEPEREEQHAWETEGDLPWEPERRGRPGERPFDHWPEEDAGPEWRMWRDLLGDEEEG